MNTKFLVIVIVLAIFIVAGVIWMGGVKEEPIVDNDDDDIELSVVEEELERLPRELTVRDRIIVLDNESINQELREEYAQLPYELEIGDETRLIEAEFEFRPEETPIAFIERVLDDTVPPQEELDAYSEEMYQYSVSFYSLDEDIVAEYPSADHPEAGPAEEGLSVYVRAMNFPDDSVGGNETRYDFIVSEDGNWMLVWIGERTFCRRPDQEFWQPADQLCP